ncbi:MAG TPA: hotdog domain-containing protein [Burkholderiaceae bacterium]|jgi:predicted thioesterase|nr:hotdog domain-containing protein [Burkholderiaceae bacterium]
MKHCEISQIFFSEKYVVPAAQSVQKLFGSLPHVKAYAGRMINAMATGYLVAVLESICAREMQLYLDQDEETVVGSCIQCQHRAPIPPGSIVKVDGWVIGIGDHDATFWVQASDEHEVVCEGKLRFVVVRRMEMELTLQRKCEAIKLREPSVAV